MQDWNQKADLHFSTTSTSVEVVKPQGRTGLFRQCENVMNSDYWSHLD